METVRFGPDRGVIAEKQYIIRTVQFGTLQKAPDYLKMPYYTPDCDT